MDLNQSGMGSPSLIDINSLRADSPTFVQVSTTSTSEESQTPNVTPRPKAARNFSRKLYTIEPASASSSRCPSGEVINLTSALAFIDFTSPQPVELNASMTKLQGQFTPDFCATAQSPVSGSTASSRRVTPTKLSSVPSSPVASKPVRPSFGRSISLLDSRSKTNVAPTDKQSPKIDSQMETMTRPTLMRSPTTIPRVSPRVSPQQPTTPNRFASTVGEKLGWLRSRAFSNVSATSTTTQVPASPAAAQQELEDADLIAADPLINLDISTALFPSGIVDFTDSSSFNGLLANATALIETLQTAYKQRTTQVNELRAKNASQVEDLDEAEVRTRHLRMQLSTMSARMTETELSLRSQLAEECQLRKALEIKEKERAARRRTNPYRRTSNAVGPVVAAVPGSPTVSSDNGSSTSTASEGSDSGFESDAESRYSSHYSPASSPVVSANGSPFRKLQSPQQQQSRQVQAATPSLISSCTSPEPSEASWERNSIAVGPLDPLAENFALRHRVAELESAVEACLRLI